MMRFERPGRSMHPAAIEHPLCRPKVPVPPDPNFSPVVLGKRQYLEATKGATHKLEWALVRADVDTDGVGRCTPSLFSTRRVKTPPLRCTSPESSSKK